MSSWHRGWVEAGADAGLIWPISLNLSPSMMNTPSAFISAT
jgi:hypothetical protein